MSEKQRISELTSMVDSQREQLKRYEARLRDIIRAYKSLQKEKEALESSLNALSVLDEEEEEESKEQPQSERQGEQQSQSDSPSPEKELPQESTSSPSLLSSLPPPPPQSDAEDAASSIDPASASEAEKTDGEETADEGLRQRLSASPQQQQPPSPQQQKPPSSPQEHLQPASPQQQLQQLEHPQPQHNQKHQRLKSQVATLSNALAAITNEKNKMESNFQADKRRAKEELEEISALLMAEKNAREEMVTEKSTRETEVNELKTLVTELKTKLRSHQLEREGEQSDHVVMLSELQTLLTQQKRARETLEQRLEEEKAERKKLQTALQAQEVMASYAARPGAKVDEEKPKSNPSINIENHPVFIKLKKDFQDSKTQLHRALQQERNRLREAEEEILRTNQSSEEVVRTLEDRITELSSTVGTYERLRVQDQRSLETLKDELEKRLITDSSSSVLCPTSAAGTSGAAVLVRPRARLPPIGANEEEDEEDEGSFKFVMNESMSSDPRYLLSKMKDLRTKMQVVLTSPQFKGDQISTEEIVQKLFDQMELSDLHWNCHQESMQLESEVTRLHEQLKVATQTAKAQSPVKISSDENISLKTRIVELEKEVLLRQEELVFKEQKMRREAEELKEEVFRAEKEKLEARKQEEEKWKTKLDEVVKEMKKQRDRTIYLLQQKEAEVESARNDAVEIASARERNLSRSGSHRSRHNSTLSEDRRSSSVEPGFSQCLQEEFDTGHQLQSALSSEGASLPIGGQTLHVACRESLSRVEADLRLSRKQKNDLEMALRKLQNSLALSEENHRLEFEKLSVEIERLVKNEQRSSELGCEKNMEYLKNVVFRLIMSRDSASKLQLIPVVATILQFSETEKEKALAKYHSWWVTSSSSSSSTSVSTHNFS